MNSSRIKIYPYRKGSKGAKTLSTFLGCKVLRTNNSKYKPKLGDTVINWGSSKVPNLYPASVLNSWVELAQSKLKSFLAFSESDCGLQYPDFWVSKTEIPDNAFPVVCRTLLSSHSGRGIVIANTRDDLVDAPLYVKYIKKKEEYRVHVLFGKVFFTQRKARKLSVSSPDWRVRNLSGGFVFVEAEEGVDESVLHQAILAVNTLGLDFGGVDILWNKEQKKAYVIEVNTACGLEDRTAAKYAESLLASLNPSPE